MARRSAQRDSGRNTCTVSRKSIKTFGKPILFTNSAIQQIRSGAAGSRVRFAESSPPQSARGKPLGKQMFCRGWAKNSGHWIYCKRFHNADRRPCYMRTPRRRSAHPEAPGANSRYRESRARSAAPRDSGVGEAKAWLESRGRGS